MHVVLWLGMDADMFLSFCKLRNHIERIRAFNEDNPGTLTPSELVRVDADLAPSQVGIILSYDCNALVLLTSL
jgi:hypothetical protein